MAKLTVFEIQINRDGAWKIESIFDDRELAVMEGERMARSLRYQAVRVVEETFDEETEKVGTRTVYRFAKEPQPVDSKAQPSPEVIETLRLRRRRRRRTPPKKSMVGQVIGKMFLFAAITGLALGLIYILNTIL